MRFLRIEYAQAFGIGLVCTVAGFFLALLFLSGGDSFRHWISALSGWFAGGAAIWVGVTQLRPLVQDVRRKERNEIQEEISVWTKTIREMARVYPEIGSELVAFKSEEPEYLIFGKVGDDFDEHLLAFQERALQLTNLLFEYQAILDQTIIYKTAPDALLDMRLEISQRISTFAENLQIISEFLDGATSTLPMNGKDIFSFFQKLHEDNTFEDIKNSVEQLNQTHKKFLELGSNAIIQMRTELEQRQT